ncbi:MAG: FAD-dependent monooxygenase [Altererythrobacter sp.]|nr:FAD-dependent monooxygenase [Altererythrobacter sp.]
MQRTAAVIGGGIAGLASAAALQRAGYDVTVYEQAPAIAPMGTALSIWDNAMAGLDWIGCGDAVRGASAPITQVALSRRDGKYLFGPVALEGMDAWLPMRSHLQAVLADCLGRDRLRLGVRVDGIGEQGDKVEIAIAGSPVDAVDLCVGADGIHSAKASELLGNVPQYRGYLGALGVARAVDDGWPQGLGEEIWHGTERFGLFDAGEGRRYWFYMRSEKDPAALSGIDLAFVQQRVAGWADPIGHALAATDPAATIPVAIHARATPRRLGQGRIICVGDAAHAMEPNQGQGGCQGIEDAWALGVLAGRLSPEAILPEFERQRLPRLKAVMRDSMLVGRVAHSPRSWERGMVRAIFAATSQRIDASQLRRRLRPPTYR